MTRLRLAACSLAVMLINSPLAAQEPQRSLQEVAADVWRFQNDFHSSTIVVTEDGVVVTDPINADAAEWLKGQIASRFGKPVTHLVYSHSHGDHASGGAVFDAPVVIVQENAPAVIDGVTPTVRFSERLTVLTGGKTLELTALGPGHGTDMLAMVVRPQNVAYVVDVVSPGRLPYRDFPGADLDGLARQIAAVEALDFDILLPGHARMGDSQDVRMAREYLDWLRAEVQAGLDAGRSVEEIKAGLDMGPYSDWIMAAEWGPLNVEGMARWLQAQ